MVLDDNCARAIPRSIVAATQRAANRRCDILRRGTYGLLINRLPGGVGAPALIAQGGLYAVSRHHHSRASLRVRALSVRRPDNNLRSAIVRHQSLSPFIFSSAAINSATRRSANSVRKRNSKSGVSACIKATPCRGYQRFSGFYSPEAFNDSGVRCHLPSLCCK